MATNGGTPASPTDSSPAQRLQEKHNANAAHPPTIEDAVDEEDLAHPPSSTLDTGETKPSPVLVPTGESMSEKAAGKQKEQEELSEVSRRSKPESIFRFDPKSEDLFPALGGGPKAQAPSPVAVVWGSKKPTSVGHTASNGINGNGSTPATSRTSTPPSGTAALSSVNASGAAQSQRTTSPRVSAMGRHSERIQFSPSQLLPRDQLKKPVQDVIAGINKRSKAIVRLLKSGSNGMIIFEATGPPDATRQALIDVAKEVGSKQSVNIPIPMSVRAHIIGRQGAVVQRISKQTGARIHIPKAEGLSPFEAEDDDDSTTIDVVIEGDAVSAESARKAIEAIVNERTSTVNMRLREIPPEFFPFIAGPRNSGVAALENGRQVKVQIPHHYTWSHQRPALASASGSAPQFFLDPNNQIKVSGDRLAAQEARSEIERQVNYLRHQITLSQLTIERGRHQFITGDNGILLHDLLEETGCAVILPPTTDDTETLFVTGPHDKIELGIEKVMNLATSMQMSSVDLARQHTNAPRGPQAHARALTRYLLQREAIAQLEKRHDARIVLQNAQDGPTSWEVYSRDGKNILRARSDIMNLINAYPPPRVRYVPADKFFHPYIEQQVARSLRDEYGVHLVVSDPADQTPEVILVCEGPTVSLEGERHLAVQRPTANEIDEFERLLNQAQAKILDLIQGQGELGAASVVVPRRLQDKVQKFVDRAQQDLPLSEVRVQIESNLASNINGSTATSRNSTDAMANECELFLRGPNSAVEDLAEKIVEFVKAAKQDELERGNVISFEFPSKYTNYLIGKKGENINRYREEFDVEIQINDGNIEIKGPIAKAELAKTKILALRKKLEDEVTHILKIKSQYHRDMIGAKGSQVNRLQDRYNVRVQFPRNAHVPSDDPSTVDGASDVGGSRNGRPSQALDEVIVRGPQKGADAARDELLNLLQWTIDNSYSSAVSVAQSQLPSLIGQGGREMENLRLLTGAQIDIPGSREGSDPSGRVEIHIKGNKKQVEEAQKVLEQRAKAFDNSVTQKINIDKRHHKSLIGNSGSNIRKIVLEAGGSDDRRELTRMVRFPRQDSNENTIHIEGNQAVVDKIVTLIEAFVHERDSQVSETLEVAPDKHRLLIGRGGETRRNLESQYKITLDIPKLSQEGPARSQVKLTGQSEDVERAKAHILDIVKDQAGETIQVPRCVHHIVSDNGQIFRRLRHDYKVTIDHAGQHPPPKPINPSLSQADRTRELPLITDEQDAADNHLWDIVEDGSEGKEEGDIPWILRGSPENISKARLALEKAIEQVSSRQQSSTGYLVLPDPRTYRFIIGQGGSQINSIRKQTGCKINVPHGQAKGEAIEIIGSRDGIEQAKNIILEVVQNGGNGGVGGRTNL